MVDILAENKNYKSTQVFGDYLIMLIAPFALSFIYYGSSAVYVTAASIATAVICDAAAGAVLRKRFRLKNLDSIFTGAAIAMMMPAGIALYVPVIAAAFAVLVAKVPFGGGINAPFVPAAAGFAFSCVCFKEKIFDYSFVTGAKFLGSSSIASMLAKGNSVHLNSGDLIDILCGNSAGPMGTGCILILAGCCAYLFVKRRKALLSTLGFVGVCAAFAFLFPRVNASGLTSVILELSSGSLMFAAVFFMTDFSTMPQGSLFGILYGAVGGLICMLMRLSGAYEEPICFAVLLANAFARLLEYVPVRKGADRK